MYYTKSFCFWCAFLFELLQLQTIKSSETCDRLFTNDLSPEQILRWLTDPCRYDKTVAPKKSAPNLPIVISTKIHVYYMTSDYSRNTDFKVCLLLQFRWRDIRLSYGYLTLNDVTEVISRRIILERIWIPNIYITNERHSLTLADFTDDLSVTVLPDGYVMFAVRLKTSVFCWLKLGRFPFDHQQCHLILESWRYDISQLTLKWEMMSPVTVTVRDSWVPYLTEYQLLKVTPHDANYYTEPMALNSYSSYQYSSLTLTFLLVREYGYHIMDYYLPSVLFVILSWVSFWMTPEAAPPRVLLGTSTMLTYFQLGVETGSQLPNVSLIRSNDVWFIVCTAFIFLSLVEFALVNTIWRYGQKTAKIKSKSVKQMLKCSMNITEIAKGKKSYNSDNGSFLNQRRTKNATVLNSELPYSMEMKAMGRVKFKVSKETNRQLNGGVNITSQQIAVWIDEKCRIVFPVAFVLFNTIYWSILWV
ncbi:pH-sensitive chloride channel 2-like [Daktulosphaira vitifoliae]|uniref:pH-sensitive chloride channel 2-like n=1 Tax=Daktulosphaira vitifoliae TaxID=58002 RepID=UPI0021AA2F9A|nr:pH-sensitive chloride channel 2-like [Daktulosphaira vitifoliae]